MLITALANVQSAYSGDVACVVMNVADRRKTVA